MNFMLFAPALPFPATFSLLLRIMEFSKPVVAELESVLEGKSTEYCHYVILIIIHPDLLRKLKLIIQDQAATGLTSFGYKLLQQSQVSLRDSLIFVC